MAPRWELCTGPPATTDPLLMDALLTPHRSLSARAFLYVMLAFSSMNLAVATYFALHGAWPVLCFLAIDVALLTFAFRMNYRAARGFERVRLAADALYVTRAVAGGKEMHWGVHPHWARVTETERLVRVRAGDRTIGLGGFLSPAERQDFAEALRRALSRAGQSPSTSSIV